MLVPAYRPPPFSLRKKGLRMKLWFVLSWAKRRVNDMHAYLGARTPNLIYYVSHDKVYDILILLIIQPCNNT